MIDRWLVEWAGQSFSVHRDADTSAWILVAIHSTRLGPAVGGVRLRSYDSLEDAIRDVLRLSRGMTYKFAAPNLPFGGAKTVIMAPPDLAVSARRGLLRRLGSHLQRLGGVYYCGPDAGTSPRDMDVIAEKGKPYVLCRTPALGGSGNPGRYTALGLIAAMEAVTEHLFGTGSLSSQRVLVQGTGDVGGSLIELLVAAGAEVSFSEIRPELIGRYRDELGLAFVPPDEVFDAECDIFGPCAFGGVLNADSIARLRCGAVVGSANNQLQGNADADRLRARGIVYAPDFVANVGGAMAAPSIEISGWTPERARKEIGTYVHHAILDILHTAEVEAITTHQAAMRLAERNLAKAG